MVTEYSELINRLRETSIDFGELDHVSVMMIEAADAIEDLWQALDTAQGVLSEQPSTWIPVTERLPDDGETVLIFSKTHKTILFDWIRNNEWLCFGNATHWMPLPEPPESEKA